MKISIASDHAGFEQKQALVGYLASKGHDVIDRGPDTDDRVDYPDYAAKGCKAVQDGSCALVILCCGTGVGMSMCANKMKGIRACCCSDAFSAKYTRLHNDANALCLGGRVVGPGLACELVDLFLDTPFEGGRHAGRVAKISALEQR